MFLNQLKTAFLLGLLSGLFFLFGYWLGGEQGLLMALLLAGLMNLLAYFYSDRMVLAMYKAEPLDQGRYANIYKMIEELCVQAKIPMPKLWYIPTSMANAFATGRNPEHASVAVTQGILDALEPHELRGVLAHELSHVKNRDILVATVAATIAAAIGYLAHMLQWAVIFGGTRDRDGNRSSGIGALFAAIIMPIAAMLIQLAISRSREYLADETGANISHDPLALASALEKLEAASKMAHLKPETPVETATASMFIVFPFTTDGLFQLFSTHPPMEKRIARLRRMATKSYSWEKREL
jgi:heat shock protein HtpX